MTPAIDVIFGKWTVAIIWTLSMHGSTRFTLLQRLVGDISPKVLTQRLQHLVRNGIVAREYFDESPPRVEYQVTELGRSLAPVFDAIQEWTEAHLDEVQASRDHFDT
jgi:DNA-binding HxlR family transcriptional regulator